MINATIFKTFVFSTIANFQAIDFDKHGDLYYTINRKVNNHETFDVFKHSSNWHNQNEIVHKGLTGHGSQFRFFKFQTADHAPKYVYKGLHGTILFKNWWGKGYGKATINGTPHQIAFASRINDTPVKGSFQGMALNETHAIFTLSFFHKAKNSSKKPKLLENILYIYDLSTQKTTSINLKEINLPKYGISDTNFKYHEFEGASYFNDSFFIGLKVQEKNSKKLKKVGVILKLSSNDLFK